MNLSLKAYVYRVCFVIDSPVLLLIRLYLADLSLLSCIIF